MQSVSCRNRVVPPSIFPLRVRYETTTVLSLRSSLNTKDSRIRTRGVREQTGRRVRPERECCGVLLAKQTHVPTLVAWARESQSILRTHRLRAIIAFVRFLQSGQELRRELIFRLDFDGVLQLLHRRLG
jgi:hypothetical protein